MILGCFHLSVSSALCVLACSSLLTDMHNGHGLWNFSFDSRLFDQWAIHGAKLLQSGDISGWWAGESRWYPHVKWIALSYALFIPHPIAFAPINALTWTATVFTVYAVARLIIPSSRNLAALGTMIFALMPTYFLQTTQLLKEPFYVLGVGLFLLGSVRLFKGRPGWQAVVFIVAGLHLIVSNRPYMLPVFVLLAAIFMALTIFHVPKAWTARLSISTAAIALLIMAWWHLSDVEAKFGLSGGSARFSLASLAQMTDRAVRLLQNSRAGFYGYNAGSTVDKNVMFKNGSDVLRYTLRALQLGLLSPFPTDWFHSDHAQAWKGARLLSGVEMIVLYTLLAGFAVFLCCRTVLLRLRLWLLIFSFSLLLLMGLVFPNEGLIYRMRYAYLMPIVLGGVYGWGIMIARYQVSSPKARAAGP